MNNLSIYLREHYAKQQVMLEFNSIGDNVVLSVTEMAELLGISRTAVQKQIDHDKLPAKKIGSSYVITLTRGKYNELKARNHG